MPRSCSADLRSRALGAMEAGEPPAAVARRFMIDRSTALRWRQALRDEGRREPKRAGGGRSAAISGGAAAALRRLMAEDNSLALAEYGARLLAETGVRASSSMLCRAFRALGLTLKKEDAQGRRAGPSRGPRGATGVAGGVGLGRAGPAGVPRRDRGPDQLGPPARPQPAR